MFDIAIVGAGISGLSLAKRLLDHETRHILVIGPEDQRPQTISFWEPKGQTHWYHHYVHQTWHKWSMQCSSHAVVHESQDWVYRSMNGLALKQHIEHQIQQASQVDRCTLKVLHIQACESHYQIDTASGVFLAKQVIDTRSKPIQDGLMQQHFMGLCLELPSDYPSHDTVRLMDFTLPLDDAFCFIYVLPLSPRTLLVEATYFSHHRKHKEHYLEMICQWLKKHLHLALSDCRIEYEEEGIIPMYSQPVDQSIPKIGLSGQCMRLSTGYAFLGLQAQIEQLLLNLLSGKRIRSVKVIPFWLNWLDRLFLKVLSRYPRQMPAILMGLMKQLGHPYFVRFMIGHHVRSIIKAILSMPKGLFIKTWLW